MLAAILFSITTINAQEVDTSECLTSIDTQYYKSILLNNTGAYMNIENGDIISESLYNDLFQIEDEDEHDHWDCSTLNPYKDLEIPTPFEIKFDQSTFTPPVEGRLVVTSRFGKRRRGPHKGIDLDLEIGDNVRSMLPGKVRYVGYRRGHGKTIVVRHANDIETVYAHLTNYSVEENEEVKEGQIIGTGGITGNARGSHLHLEVRYKGMCIHPEYLFNFDGSNTMTSQSLWVTNTWKNPIVHSSYRQSKFVFLESKEEAIAYQENEPKYYKVKKGDTLSEIARLHNIYISELCNLNAISKSSIISIGQVLQIR